MPLRKRGVNEGDEIAFAIARTNGPASEKLELILSRSCNVWDNAAMGFISSLKTERTARKFYRTRDDAKADVFDLYRALLQPEAPTLGSRLSASRRSAWRGPHAL